ncbi:hypothetical protein TREMEDRAFT_58213 [Tremella mesenterica DSM 1558]|uniref:uncharacterized protein n=1 Tax=Tremella mesenterica (strain ATCC 24925 / CBS 8224 / DSM 1558 / NBRC 9311 / NRRL Y-6157 / RJB 2259-6 / UBC 559-6) TaxID=578456 RepID=UPI0003F4A376|nr:uncharacterized protein TREMEDRAFT_58213 [Tremella mesenterica DSM 1558]EIW72060.1 hypothetical protein TREMEDRAFT_58213 [Tremella mesenterica DSM 1558]
MSARNPSEESTIPSTIYSTTYSPPTQPEAPPTTPDGQKSSMTDGRPPWDWETLNASLNAIVIGNGDQTRTPPDKAPARAIHSRITSLDGWSSSGPSQLNIPDSALSSAGRPQNPGTTSRASLKRHRSGSDPDDTKVPDSLQHSRKRTRYVTPPTSKRSRSCTDWPKDVASSRGRKSVRTNRVQRLLSDSPALTTVAQWGTWLLYGISLVWKFRKADSSGSRVAINNAEASPSEPQTPAGPPKPVGLQVRYPRQVSTLSELELGTRNVESSDSTMGWLATPDQPLRMKPELRVKPEKGC